ncbi:hypothetical protein A0H81_03902 [Grifola frondosa]|uniref:Uncharacterized protein n=1 Tax=Grifola frondosa TaxID=5627 RepID=A0A1C7MIB5_GRIFR|nr:hypothetical protein A0H81_03902 [Grifola frondosa]
MFDLYVGYDERLIADSSRDLTTFQTPFGPLRLITLPMGWTNSVLIFHDNVTHILQAEIPHVTIPYIDGVPCRGPATWYRLPDGTFETIPTMLVSSRYFVFPSSSSLDIAVLLKGDFPTNRELLSSEIGVCAMISPKSVHFSEQSFDPKQIAAQDDLKQALLDSPALRAIDYTLDASVILAVDTSYIAVGFYLCHLIVEVDARYIKGMLQNPDISPSASINCWIIAILTFHFTLEEDDFEDWINTLYGFPHLIQPAWHSLPSTPTLAIFTNSMSDLSDISDPIPSYDSVPRSEKAAAADQRLHSVRLWLSNLAQPPDLSDSAYEAFVRYCLSFFSKDSCLWRKDSQAVATLLAELDGSVLDRPITAFRIIPYFARHHIDIPDDLLDISMARLREMEASKDQGDDEDLDSITPLHIHDSPDTTDSSSSVHQN